MRGARRLRDRHPPVYSKCAPRPRSRAFRRCLPSTATTPPGAPAAIASTNERPTIANACLGATMPFAAADRDARDAAERVGRPFEIAMRSVVDAHDRRVGKRLRAPDRCCATRCRAAVLRPARRPVRARGPRRCALWPPAFVGSSSSTTPRRVRIERGRDHRRETAGRHADVDPRRRCRARDGARPVGAVVRVASVERRSTRKGRRSPRSIPRARSRRPSPP